MVHKFACENCSVEFERPRPRHHGAPWRFCGHRCRGLWSVGEKSHNWKSGRCVPRNPEFYIVVRDRENPRSSRGYVLEHIKIAEGAFGNPLPSGAEVHHWDGNCQNNSPSNLVICQDRRYHFLLEARTRRLKDTGSLSLKRCRLCKTIKALDKFSLCSRTWDKKMADCSECNSRKSSEYYNKYKSARAAA